VVMVESLRAELPQCHNIEVSLKAKQNIREFLLLNMGSVQLLEFV
jgi:hypothetical protein